MTPECHPLLLMDVTLAPAIFKPEKNLKKTKFFSGLKIAGARVTSITTDSIVRKRSKIWNRYNQAPHLTKDTNRKMTTSQLDITNESQEVSPFPAGDHKASFNRRVRKHNKNKTEIT